MLPLLRERIPAVAERITRDHQAVSVALAKLAAQVDGAPARELYHALCDLTAQYLQHMRTEELELEPAIRAALSVDDLIGFGRRAIERTAPSDQRMMLGWIVPALPPRDAENLLGHVPETTLATELRARLSPAGR